MRSSGPFEIRPALSTDAAGLTAVLYDTFESTWLPNITSSAAKAFREEDRPAAGKPRLRSAVIATWAELKIPALGQNLPEVTLADPWGQKVLMAHGMMRHYCAALRDGVPYKAGPEEREMMLAADPERFFLYRHYTPHGLFLTQAGDW